MRSLGRIRCLLIASLGWASPAWSSEPIRFEYQAPEGCPDQAAFVERVRQRTRRAKFASPGELARTFTVTVTSKEQASSARVEFVDSNGERVVRAVSGETCDEVVSGIALVAALAIDARASADEAATTAPPSDKPVPPKPATATTKEDSVEQPRTEPAPKGLRWEVGVSGAANTWSAPEVAYGLGVFGELDFNAAVFRYLRFGLLRTTSSAFVGDRSATFTWLGGRIAACPVSLSMAEHLAFAPCLAADLGALSGKGTKNDELLVARSDTIFLPVGMASAELRYDLDDFLVFELRAEVGFPLRRWTFEFNAPDETVFEIPEVGFGTGASVGLRFP